MFDILKFLDDAPLKLTNGVGKPDTGGCWMAALSVYSGASWGDHPPCVCPVIRSLCIAINDSISSDSARGRILSGVLLEPVGTATDDKSIVEARMWRLVDAAIRRFATSALRAAGLAEEAEKLERLPRVTAANAAAASDAAAGASRAASRASAAASDAAAGASRAASRASDAASDAAAGASRAAYAAAGASRAAYAASDAAAAAYAAADASRAASAASDRFVEGVVLPVVMELCSIGNKMPVEMNCDELAFRRATQCVAST